ncbi:MAG: hypothetical protein IPO90_14875 [Flavobacteriales bacterium]|nr:hypothetical protein [Flavobacteriales bacterium]MBL0046364.1 hypothetical protein [Flavobacteriales bacterium]
MEPATSPTRSSALTRLCLFSFANQGVMFPVYFLGIFSTALLSRMTPEEVEALLRTSTYGLLQTGQLEQMLTVAESLRENGVWIMLVLALRTLARFIGVLRMWKLKGDGFHIYTTAQLLGILLPMLIGGQAMFSGLGLITAVMWCYLYWSQLKVLKVL